MRYHLGGLLVVLELDQAASSLQPKLCIRPSVRPDDLRGPPSFQRLRVIFLATQSQCVGYFGGTGATTARLSSLLLVITSPNASNASMLTRLPLGCDDRRKFP